MTIEVAFEMYREFGRARGSQSDIQSLVGVVRLDQCQEILFQLTANKLNVARFTLVVDYPGLRQFWEMGVVQSDPDALSMFVRFLI